MYISIYVFNNGSFHLHICQSIDLSIDLFIDLSIHISIDLSFHLSFHLSFYLSLYLINDFKEIHDGCRLLPHRAQHSAERQTEEDDTQSIGPVPR